jgi:two-component system OmpR family response regulator
MNKERIHIVDDDRRLCRLLGRYLEHDGYEVSFDTSGEDISQKILDSSISLILLDVMLPGKDGLTLAREVRELSNIPIIFLTAKADLSDKIKGLELGADDYITKPFEEKELLARVHSVIRRAKLETFNQNKSIATFAGWTLNLVNQTLTSHEGEQIDITSSEYRLLSALVSKPNTVLTRDEILKMISGREWSPLDRSADMAIAKLRKKIEQDPKRPEIIRTVRNKGYQLTAAVEFSSYTH